MQKKRYEVHTRYGWFSLDEGAYQDYLAGRLWIGWPPEGKDSSRTVREAEPAVSARALELRTLADARGVWTAMEQLNLPGCPVTFPAETLEDVSIDELCLSVRASNGLKRAGLTTLGRLADGMQQEGGLSRIRNLGVKSVAEIRHAFLEEAYRRLTPPQRAEYWQKLLDRGEEP